jgi:LuxR family maltose regulon positive regulatory protein
MPNASGRPALAGIPPPPRGVVARRRLFDALERGAGGPVTLVSAPAGSGKTTLVTSWLREAPPEAPVAWVAVERDERDPAHFWTTVVDALRRAGALAGAPALEGLTPTPRSAEHDVANQLAEGLRAEGRPVVLAIDDVHHLRSAVARAGLARLLARASPPLRTVLLARGDPELGLHRLRIAGLLAEIRGPELDFTAGEAGALLHADGVEVSEQAVRRLHRRTEGWAAGLRLAAIPLAAGADPARFVAEFSGSERGVAEYLVHEVLAGLAPAVRRVLLRTSVLERVNGALADSLAGGAGGERILQDLEDSGAFVTSLDAGRTWFRYHQLLGDLLRLELRREAPGEVAALHRAAARWHAAHGSALEAVQHAQEGGDWGLARDELMEHWFGLFLDGRQRTLETLVRGFPPAQLHSQPELKLLVAADQLTAGRLAEAEARLAEAHALAAGVPEPRRQRFEVTLAVVGLMRARRRGDLAGAATAAAAAVEDPLANDDLRALALMNLGIVELWAGRPRDSDRHLQAALALARRIERPLLVLGSLGALAQAANVLLRPADAERHALEAIALAERLGLSREPLLGFACIALSGLLTAKGRLAESEEWHGRAEALLSDLPDPEAHGLLRTGTGALRLAQGRTVEALESLRRADETRVGAPAPAIIATWARMWQLRARIALGEGARVRAALAEAGEAAVRDAQWCNVAARLHLAEGDPPAAAAALAPVRDGRAPPAHVTIELESLLLEAVARHRMGEPAVAERALERALDRAAPAGHAWLFLTLPESRRALERHPPERTAHGAFVAELLDRLATWPGDGPRPALTRREQTVLGLLPTNLTAAEIGNELMIGVNTVKTHMRTLYAKLGAHRRAEAVARARQLGLLAPRHQRRDPSLIRSG